ncbi:MAG: peptidase M14, partial [Candidatus Omnitrophica bacterium]|nr:peptidase M14 [Candidatus Omnitrophota bacterium]
MMPNWLPRTRFARIGILFFFLFGRLYSQSFLVRIFYPDRQSLMTLAADLDIWDVYPSSGYFVALVETEQLERLQSEGYWVEIEEIFGPTLVRVFGDLGLGYQTVEEIYSTLRNLPSLYPSLCRVVDIGDSWDKTITGGASGYDLLCLVLTNQALLHAKPAFFLLGGSHPREMAPPELALCFAEYLLEQYGIDPDVTWLLDWTEIHIFPLHNPDGRQWADLGYHWRKNTNQDSGVPFPYYGVDLNRNFDHHWEWSLGASDNPAAATYRGETAASEPETRSLQDYLSLVFTKANEGLFITLHSYGERVLWPWGDVITPAPDAASLEMLGRRIAFFNQYQPLQSSLLYPASGAVDDWVYGKLGVAALTVELGTEFFQNYSDFREKIWPENRQALLYACKTTRSPYSLPFGPEVTEISLNPEVAVKGEPVYLTALANL